MRTGLPRTFATAMRSLGIQRVRSALSILGVVCGVAALFGMVCAGEGAKRRTLRHVEALGARNVIVRARAASDAQRARAAELRSRGLTLDDAGRIERGLPAAEHVGALIELEASVAATKAEITPQLAAVSASWKAVHELDLASGRFLAPEDVARRNLVAVLGHGVAQALAEEGKVGAVLRIEQTDFRVVGVLASRAAPDATGSVVAARNHDDMILIPLGAQRTVVAGSGDQLDEIVVKTRERSDVVQAGAIVGRMLEVAHSGVDDYSVIVPRELLREAQAARRTSDVLLGVIGLLSLLVGGIGIMNAMLAGVMERKREIGVRRAVGATRRDIVLQFLCETVVLSALGWAAGLLAGLALVGALAVAAGWEVVLVPWGALASLLMAALVGLASGIYPALQAARIDPIDALRAQ